MMNSTSIINNTVMKPLCVTALSLMLAAMLPLSASDDSPYRGSDPAGTVAYSLPSTVLTFEVEAVCEKFYAGPYADYASKYLGIDVRREDEVSCKLSSVKMTPYTEADLSRRYLLNLKGETASTTFLKLTAAGLVSSAESVPGHTQDWRFPSIPAGDFADKAITANLTTEATTLYRSVKSESSYGKIAVQQDMLVEKTREQRAAEIAKTIISIREQRMCIVTGDTDATFSGEALGAAVEELTRLEQEYLTLFTGYSEYDTQTMTFDLVPQKDRDSQLYVAFRISDSAGLLPAGDISGRPVVLEISQEKLAAPQQEQKQKKQASSKVPVVVYRVPAICSLRLADGKSTILQARIPVYQFGEETSLPVNLELKDRKGLEKHYMKLDRF